MAGEHCSAGCRTRNHRSYTECLRDKDIGHMALGGTGPSSTTQRRWSRENDLYRQAKHDGLQPAAVTESAVHRAYEEASGGS